MSDTSRPRFSDFQLTELRKDFDKHKDDFDIYKDEQEKRWAQLADLVEHNTRATQRIAEATERQELNTAGIIQLHADLKSAARVGVGVQKFLAWLVALGTGGAAIAAALVYVIDKLAPP